MLDKIRAHAKSQLHADYQANLGKGFDERCARFLRVDYNQLVDRVKQGGSDEEILHWCFGNGYRPSDDEIYVWNEFMRKRGWNDEVSETLKRRKKEAGMAGRSEIERCSPLSTPTKVDWAKTDRWPRARSTSLSWRRRRIDGVRRWRRSHSPIDKLPTRRPR